MTRYERLEAAGWYQLHSDDFRETWCRWGPGSKREELHLCLDRSGNLYAWSAWTSERITIPDQQKGRRDRLFEYAEATR